MGIGATTDLQRMTARHPIRITPEMEPVVQELYLRFCEKFGREPGPSDPVFFDPDADSPVTLPPEKLERLWTQVVEAWLARGEITRATAYAMLKTGLAVTPQNRHLLSPAELAEWNQALDAAPFLN